MSEIPERLRQAFWRSLLERVTGATQLWLAAEQGERDNLPELRR